MEAITIRLSPDTLESIDEEADEHDRTRSEHVREVIRIRNDHERVRSEYAARIDELERENDRLRDQLVATNQRVDQHTELVRYVQAERTLERRRVEASVITRAKWWLFGMDPDRAEV